MRPYLSARMPIYPEEEVGILLRQLPKLDTLKSSWAGAAPGHGERVFSAEGKNCVQCHGIGTRNSKEYPGINLATTGKRLTRAYFENFLLAKYSTHPPAVSPGEDREARKPTEEEVAALWKWLHSLAD